MGDGGKESKRTRPRTAGFARRVPRYLQDIHGKVTKDDTFDVKSFYYRDLVIVRYKENQRAQVINETQFIKMFLLRNNDPFWRTVDYIQTNVKSQVGLGTPIVIKFYADLAQDPENPGKLKYDLEQFPEDEDIKDELVY